MIDQWMQKVINEKLKGISFEQTVTNDFGPFKRVTAVRNDEWITIFDFNLSDKSFYTVDMRKEEVLSLVDKIRSNNPITE